MQATTIPKITLSLDIPEEFIRALRLREPSGGQRFNIDISIAPVNASPADVATPAPSAAPASPGPRIVNRGGWAAVPPQPPPTPAAEKHVSWDAASDLYTEASQAWDEARYARTLLHEHVMPRLKQGDRIACLDDDVRGIISERAPKSAWFRKSWEDDAIRRRIEAGDDEQAVNLMIQLVDQHAKSARDKALKCIGLCQSRTTPESTVAALRANVSCMGRARRLIDAIDHEPM